MGQVALEDKTVYLCQKSVITMKNQVRPVCSPKDKIWSRTDKLQRCRRLPLEQAKLRQILENNSEGVLIRKWFDRWYLEINHVRISQQHESLRGRPIFSVRIFTKSTRMDPCLMIEEIPAHVLRPWVLTRCQSPSSSAKIAQRRHEPHLLRAVHLRQPRTRKLRTNGVKKRRSF